MEEACSKKISKARLYASWFREHIGLSIAAGSLAITSAGFIIGTFATINYVDTKHNAVVSQQTIDRDYNAAQFHVLNENVNEVGRDVKEILRSQRGKNAR